MKSIFQLALSVGLLVGGGTYGLIKAKNAMREMAFNKIHKGLSPTKKLNDKLWEGVNK
ncbi:MAG: hypothetical protein N4A33_07815 [Bacteriovoracaceae bacterium]|jgi:multisubunit Na+/H+ antiporter MnhC subunit|nr:hypothetical protein [Bacteriovoracaceae bacterium]